MKNYLLVFRAPHEGPTLFLLEDCEEKEEGTVLIEQLMAVPYNDKAERLKLAKELECFCYDSKRFQYNPDDNTLSGETVIYNINLW